MEFALRVIKIGLFSAKRALKYGMAGAVFLALAVYPRALGPMSPTVLRLDYRSNPLTIHGVIPSMIGPTDKQDLSVRQVHRDNLLWLTGIQASAFDAKTMAPRNLNNLCHTQVMSRSRMRFLDSTDNQGIGFGVLFPGVSRIQFPKNFALPFRSDESLNFMSMVFNRDPNLEPYSIVVDQTLEYLEEATSDIAIRPLYHRMLRLALPTTKAGDMGESCAMSKDNEVVERADRIQDDRDHIDHWMVPPGKHVYRSVLPAGLTIPADTTLHYAYVHLHAYGNSLELVDLTEGHSIFKANARHYATGPDIEKSDIFSSEAGVPVYKNHSYELVAEYDNTSAKPVDAMAMIYLYFADHEFLRQRFNRQFHRHPSAIRQAAQ